MAIDFQMCDRTILFEPHSSKKDVILFSYDIYFSCQDILTKNRNICERNYFFHINKLFKYYGNIMLYIRYKNLPCSFSYRKWSQF